MKILVIDNYDSFTYNLVYYISVLTGERPDVFRNDKISVSRAGEYDRILLSPGPGIPSEAGICKSLIEKYAAEKSILGICLGHQAIAEVFGGKLHNTSEVFHGVSTEIKVNDPSENLFSGLPSPFQGGRYHSWIVSPQDLPPSLKITCVDNEGTIMGIRHEKWDIHGLQFHPESVLTPEGIKIIENWLNHHSK